MAIKLLLTVDLVRIFAPSLSSETHIESLYTKIRENSSPVGTTSILVYLCASGCIVDEPKKYFGAN